MEKRKNKKQGMFHYTSSSGSRDYVTIFSFYFEKIHINGNLVRNNESYPLFSRNSLTLPQSLSLSDV
jgi:hypothetical protein